MKRTHALVLMLPAYVLWFSIFSSCADSEGNQMMESRSGVVPTGESAGNSVSVNDRKERQEMKKYYKNIQASIEVPEGHREIEKQYSYSFVGPGDASVYIASLYLSQDLAQVKQGIITSLTQNGYNVSLTSDYSANAAGLQAADVNMTSGGGSYPGYIVIREMAGNRTYVFLGCVEQQSAVTEMKGTTDRMASSIEIRQTETGSGSPGNPINGNVTAPMKASAVAYRSFLADKVLLNNKQSRDIISGDDHRASHGKWILSEDVNKTRRFLFCAGGLSYFRFISTGWQITGDYGTVQLDKWSGFWKVIEENGKFYIYMEDERNGRFRTWEINELTNDIIVIDKRPYKIFTQKEGGDECYANGNQVVLPD